MRRGMPKKPQNMHREEGDVEADKHDPEIPVPKGLIHKTAGGFGNEK